MTANLIPKDLYLFRDMSWLIQGSITKTDKIQLDHEMYKYKNNLTLKSHSILRSNNVAG